MPVEMDTTHFDLELYIWQAPGSLYLDIVYNTDLFNADTI